MANEKAFLAMFVGYGAGMWCTFSAIRRTLAMAEARHWPSVQGKILESVQYSDPGGKATHFRIRYEFTVGDRIEGNTPRLSGVWFWSNDAQADFVCRYVRGDAVEVFYDPRNPRRNCLDRDDRGRHHCPVDHRRRRHRPRVGAGLVPVLQLLSGARPTA